MSKGLEELKRLAYENACCRCQYYTDNKCTNKDTCVWLEIETKLKDYEELEEKLGFDPTIFKQDFETLMKEHKALEIIKKKNVCIHDLKKSETLKEYNSCREWGDEELTQKEYKLLKEVLS